MRRPFLSLMRGTLGSAGRGGVTKLVNFAELVLISVGRDPAGIRLPLGTGVPFTIVTNGGATKTGPPPSLRIVAALQAAEGTSTDVSSRKCRDAMVEFTFIFLRDNAILGQVHGRVNHAKWLLRF